MKILIINLTRMGDIIQTFPAVNALKKNNNLIHYLALKDFSTILKQCKSIDKIITVSHKNITENIPNKWEKSIKIINDLLQNLNNEKYDIIISPIASNQSALFLNLINASKKYGLMFNENREKKFTSNWMSYHIANEHNLGDHSFNLVDIFSGIANISSSPNNFTLFIDDSAKKKSEQLWENHFLTNSYVIGFHIGASRSNKAWDPKKFKEVIIELLKNKNNKIILFGSYAEKELNHIFSNIKNNNFINLIEKTNIMELTAIIKKLDLFITNDTGPMHIASALKIKIINISLGPVSHWETSPYLENSIIIKPFIKCHPCNFDKLCEHLKCHSLISVELVLKIIDKIKDNIDLYEEKDYQIWETTLDPFGKLHALPFYKREISEKEFFFEAKRFSWNIILNNNNNIELKEYLSYLEKKYFLKKYLYEQEKTHLIKLIELNKQFIYHLNNFIDIVKSNNNLIQNYWLEIKTKKNFLFKKAKEFNLIYDMFLFAQFRESNIEEIKPKSIIKKTILIYSDLNLQLDNILKYISL